MKTLSCQNVNLDQKTQLSRSWNWWGNSAVKFHKFHKKTVAKMLKFNVKKEMPKSYNLKESSNARKIKFVEKTQIPKSSNLMISFRCQMAQIWCKNSTRNWNQMKKCIKAKDLIQNRTQIWNKYKLSRHTNLMRKPNYWNRAQIL